jgi:alkanesulfonate monooxygenase SsuD/methylene tetrahydromethanopterin reductase-like flavin-dependent oxidoreductase (luciferase family)
MKLSLIVRGQHPPGDSTKHLRDDLDLVRAAERLGFDGIVKGLHDGA